MRCLIVCIPIPQILHLCCRRDKLSSECKAAMFDEETLMGESIDFQFPMKAACQQVRPFNTRLPVVLVPNFRIDFQFS